MNMRETAEKDEAAGFSFEAPPAADFRAMSRLLPPVEGAAGEKRHHWPLALLCAAVLAAVAAMWPRP